MLKRSVLFHNAMKIAMGFGQGYTNDKSSNGFDNYNFE